MGDEEKGNGHEKMDITPSSDSRPSIFVRRRNTANPHRDIEVLRQRLAELRRSHPEVAESERLRKEITALERQHHKEEMEEEIRELQRITSKHDVKFITRPKMRAYFRGSRLFRSLGDNEWAATSSISLFTDLLFVGVLAVTGNMAVTSSEAIDLAQFVVQFLPSWRIWCFIRDIVAIYEMNAVSQRFLILWILCLLVGYTVKYPLTRRR